MLFHSFSLAVVAAHARVARQWRRQRGHHITASTLLGHSNIRVSV